MVKQKGLEPLTPVETLLKDETAGAVELNRILGPRPQIAFGLNGAPR
jgi:hypothetical protein